MDVAVGNRERRRRRMGQGPWYHYGCANITIILALKEAYGIAFLLPRVVS